MLTCGAKRGGHHHENRTRNKIVQRKRNACVQRPGATVRPDVCSCAVRRLLVGVRLMYAHELLAGFELPEYVGSDAQIHFVEVVCPSLDEAQRICEGHGYREVGRHRVSDIIVLRHQSGDGPLLILNAHVPLQNSGGPSIPGLGVQGGIGIMVEDAGRLADEISMMPGFTVLDDEGPSGTLGLYSFAVHTPDNRFIHLLDPRAVRVSFALHFRLATGVI